MRSSPTGTSRSTLSSSGAPRPARTSCRCICIESSPSPARCGKARLSVAGRWVLLTTARESCSGASSTASRNTLRSSFPGTAADSICRCFTTADSCTACRRRATGTWARTIAISNSTTTSAAIISVTSTSWNYVQLDELARLLGFPGKIGMDGSKVWEAYQSGKIDDIRKYCETDVANTYLVFQRFQLLRGACDEALYRRELELVRDTLAHSNEAHWREFVGRWS